MKDDVPWALGITVSFCILAMIAGIVMVLAGIWGDWRWLATGVVTLIVAGVVGLIADEISS